ncbi:MAG: hypothetical protein JNM70_20040 [Anaerolineae bacterium]|nr:hypothetical protein [Anaerolineae bacterium]
MTTPSAAQPSRTGLARWQPSEDWLATFIGLAIVLIIGAGLLGPGPQTANLTAAAGETKSAQLLPLSGWRVTATLGGTSATVENSISALTAGSTVVITCREGTLTAQAAEVLPSGLEAPAANRAQIVLANECAADAAVSYRTSAAIPWPVFNVFNR